MAGHAMQCNGVIGVQEWTGRGSAKDTHFTHFVQIAAAGPWY